MKVTGQLVTTKNNQTMRKAEFTVPQEVAVEFCEELVNHSLTNEVTGTTEDNELVIEVSYEKDESREVDELESHLAELCDGLENEE